MYGYVTEGRYGLDDFNWNEDGTVGALKDGVVDASGVTGVLFPGALKLKDLDGDGSPDMTIIGDANPKHTGGLTVNGRIYNFDLSASFTWSYGNDIYNANKIEYTSTNKYYFRNMTSEMKDGKRWTFLNSDGSIAETRAEMEALNANTTMWSPYIGKFMLHSWAVEDGSFIRLNTLTLGYTF
ncbi:MAG: SusC/RagA family protein, partial [Bacteroides sp.]|nr:SusC/RagA family protein [Bacteroides sp.]